MTALSDVENSTADAFVAMLETASAALDQLHTIAETHKKIGDSAVVDLIDKLCQTIAGAALDAVRSWPQ